MNPRRPYNPDRRKSGQDSRAGSLWIFIALPLIGATLFFIFRPRAAAPQPTPFDVSSTPPPATLPVTDIPLPTVTLLPEILETSTPSPEITDEANATPPSSVVRPSSSPTALLAPVATQIYLTQSGDTLPALAARFGVNPADINAPSGLQGSTTLVENQLLVIPQVLSDTGPGKKIIPDSELVFSGGGAGFDPQSFAVQQGGYLATYLGFMDEMTLSGGDVLLLTAQQHSINPRLLAALLEYESGWVTNPDPQGDALAYPLGYLHTYRKELPAQLSWAASQLAIGYYGWRAGTLTELHFPDGSALRLDPTLNAGTVGLQYFFAQTRNRPEWDTAIEDFAATYQKFFGDPFARAVDPLLPADLTQPELRLPFQPGHTWYFSGGPHGAWEHGGAQAALDFAPPSAQTGCVKSEQLVVASAPGQIVRRGSGSLLLDLDGDGREATGWVILYLHVTELYRLPVGSFVETGDTLGHPSCQGGIATGTHFHIARKYNGEWIPADGLIPFNLSGWVAHAGVSEYEGTLTRGDETVTACTCGSASTAIKE